MKLETIKLPTFGDERGSLVVLEGGKNIPFEIKRVYYMFDTQKDIRRGFHAHKELRQIAIPVKGSCRFLMDDGHEKKDILLDNPNTGLIIEPLIWHEMYDYSNDCVLMVLASDHYDESDYIRNYQDFEKEVQNG